jgi:predicted transcriptional regulator
MNYNRIVYDHDLPHRAVAVYMYLRDRANKEGKCFPSIQTIKTDLKLSKSTVIRALHDLEQAGLITKEERWRTNGGRSSTLYALST